MRRGDRHAGHTITIHISIYNFTFHDLVFYGTIIFFLRRHNNFNLLNRPVHEPIRLSFTIRHRNMTTPQLRTPTIRIFFHIPYNTIMRRNREDEPNRLFLSSINRLPTIRNGHHLLLVKTRRFSIRLRYTGTTIRFLYNDIRHLNVTMMILRPNKGIPRFSLQNFFASNVMRPLFMFDNSPNHPRFIFKTRTIRRRKRYPRTRTSTRRRRTMRSKRRVMLPLFQLHYGMRRLTTRRTRPYHQNSLRNRLPIRLQRRVVTRRRRTRHRRTRTRHRTTRPTRQNFLNLVQFRHYPP